MNVSGGSAVMRSMIISSNFPANGVLTIPGGQVTAFDKLVVGDCASNAVGQITVNGGTLYVTNATHTGYLDLRSGTLTLSGAGVLVVDRLVMTNTCGVFVRNGGTFVYGSATLDPNGDFDGDGLPNGWEQAHGLDPLDPNGNNGPNGDPDGDGMSNLQEYLAGTDPTNGASAFRIVSLVQTGNDMLVTWTTAGGHNYVVQAAPDLRGSYSNISPTIAIMAPVMRRPIISTWAVSPTNRPAFTGWRWSSRRWITSGFRQSMAHKTRVCRSRSPSPPTTQPTGCLPPTRER